MGQLISSRRAALEGLGRILDAGAPEELFTGPEDDAVFLYYLLADVAPAPDDVLRVIGRVSGMARVGDEDDRTIQREKLEDHAGGVRDQRVGSQQVRRDVGVRVPDQVNSA
jgi:hypothetical protein